MSWSFFHSRHVLHLVRIVIPVVVVNSNDFRLHNLALVQNAFVTCLVSSDVAVLFCGVSISIGHCNICTILGPRPTEVHAGRSNITSRRSTVATSADVFDECPQYRDASRDDGCRDFGRCPNNKLASFESEVARSKELKFGAFDEGSSRGTLIDVSIR